MRDFNRRKPQQSKRRRCGIGLLLTAGIAFSQAARAADLPHPPPSLVTLNTEIASADARLVAAWVIANRDNKGLPFVIVDKAGAKVFVLDAQGRLAGTASALLGLSRGDDSPPGIGDRALATITPLERNTPSGRFVASLGENMHGSTVLWVDYGAALSLHAVVTTKPAERRLKRLATPSPADNRISYGCINVPAHFFSAIVQPLFKGTAGIVYILPETRSVASVFFTTRPSLAVEQAGKFPNPASYSSR